MGSISYDGMIVRVDDRTLTHLQIVIVNKLRRGDSFLMSWKDSLDVGAGRSSIWIHPHVLVHFKFDGGRVPAINERWLADLSELADGPRGLIVIAERGEIPGLQRAPKTEPIVTMIDPALHSEVVSPAMHPHDLDGIPPELP